MAQLVEQNDTNEHETFFQSALFRCEQEEADGDEERCPGS